MPGIEKMSSAAPQTTRLKIDKQLYFPHCLMLDLDTRRFLEERIALYTELNFSPAWHELKTRRYGFFKKDWRVRFAIRSGELIFMLKGVTCPLKARAFIQKLPVNVKIKRQSAVSESVVDKLSQKRGTKNSAYLKVASSPEAVMSDTSELSQDLSTTHEQKTAISEEDSEFSVIMVHTTGAEGAPVWTFESKRLTEYLLGLFNYKLADLYPSNGAILIRAEFNTSAPAICIQEIDSIEYVQASDRKKMILKAQVRKVLHELMLKKKCLASCTIYEERL